MVDKGRRSFRGDQVNRFSAFGILLLQENYEAKDNAYFEIVTYFLQGRNRN